jgi:hypothetical protein
MRGDFMVLGTGVKSWKSLESTYKVNFAIWLSFEIQKAERHAVRERSEI